jgi:hypothetical protein
MMNSEEKETCLEAFGLALRQFARRVESKDAIEAIIRDTTAREPHELIDCLTDFLNLSFATDTTPRQIIPERSIYAGKAILLEFRRSVIREKRLKVASASPTSGLAPLPDTRPRLLSPEERRQRQGASRHTRPKLARPS